MMFLKVQESPQGMATGPASVLADGQYVAMYRHIRLDEGVRGTVM